MFCHLCGSRELSEIKNYRALKQVSSAVKPSQLSGRLMVCGQCGTAQALCDAEWESRSNEIYAHYDIFHQSGGALDQTTFDPSTGKSSPRSEILLTKLKLMLDLPTNGSLLDAGCGRGAMLHAASKVLPEWQLGGQDLSGQHATQVLSIPSVHSFYTCPLNRIYHLSDVVTLVHVLEHIANPTLFLEQVRHAVKPGGLLIIQVPDCGVNPFMLLVADHASHFDARTLQQLLELNGFKIRMAPGNLVPKELTVVVEVLEHSRKPSYLPYIAEETLTLMHAHVKFLEEAKSFAARLAAEKPLGIFGTSIAGTWAYAELGDSVQFYVDEDPQRVGRELFGRMVYDLKSAPKDSNVLVLFPPILSERIAKRLKNVRSDLTIHSLKETSA